MGILRGGMGILPMTEGRCLPTAGGGCATSWGMGILPMISSRRATGILPML